MSEPAKNQRPRKRPPQPEPVREPRPELVRPRLKPEGRKEKSPGLVVNKAAEIRRVASLLVSQGELPRPKTIRDHLAGEGIVVTGPQVSMALTNTEFAFRRHRIDWEPPQVRVPDPALAFQLVDLEDVQKARVFVEDLGSLEKALAALVALQQFGGKQVAAKERTDAPTTAADCRWPEGEKAKKPTS